MLQIQLYIFYVWYMIVICLLLLIIICNFHENNVAWISRFTFFFFLQRVQKIVEMEI